MATTKIYDLHFGTTIPICDIKFDDIKIMKVMPLPPQREQTFYLSKEGLISQTLFFVRDNFPIG